MLWWLIAPELLPVVVFAVSFAREPRRLRTGVYLVLVIGWLTVLGLIWLLATVSEYNHDLAMYVIVAVVLVGGLSVAALSVFLVIAGITLVRKEGFGLRRLLSVALGVLLMGFLAAIAFVMFRASKELFLWLVLVGIPAGYLGLGFVAFVVYGAFYSAWMNRFGPKPGVVIVLGSGLIDGRVPPLLASRLRKGRAVYDKAVAAGRQVLMITSGGKGEDEPISEAAAMRDFLVADGMDPSVIVTEECSRNTRENLVNAAELLVQRQTPGPAAVVTSNFHALRAAFLMRVAGIRGYAVGAPTARYFWPTAIIREYVAELRDHLLANAVMVTLCSIPLAFAIGTALAGHHL